jgi:hypothetical protein
MAQKYITSILLRPALAANGLPHADGGFQDQERSAVATDRGVARRRRDAYVAGIVHRRDLRSSLGSRLFLEVPDGRRNRNLSGPCPAVFTDAERLALADFLARYRGLTREAYTLDLRQFSS